MNILVLKSSPHLHGTSNTIVDKFIEGAQEGKNNIEVIDLTKININPCHACDACAMNGKCVQKDDGNNVLAKILNSDCLVLASPVYYFGVSAQLKTMSDRFYAQNSAIIRKHLKVIYIVTAWNDDSVVMKAISEHFNILTDYLKMEEVGRILAKGAGIPSMIKKEYLVQAYNIGKSLEGNGGKR